MEDILKIREAAYVYIYGLEKARACFKMYCKKQFNCTILENFYNLLENFNFSGHLENILKFIRNYETCGKTLCVWAKNQGIFGISEKIFKKLSMKIK